jgi:16S rRNA (guanine966-N2)-methyltransferase
MSSIRITGGKYKGRTIQVSQGAMEIRPAMDMMRESLFSILGDLTGCSFMDLFSGSGIIGLEAASRNADPVACVERDRAKFSQLLENVALADTRLHCHCLPVERFILRNKTPWNYIFCDPPFPYQFKSKLLELIGQTNSLKPEGRLLIHYPAKEILPETIAGLIVCDERKYGRSHVRFYKRSDAEVIKVT